MLHFFSVSVDLLFIIYPTTTTLGAFDFVSSIVFVFLVPLSHFQMFVLYKEVDIGWLSSQVHGYMGVLVCHI
jgi:hypothetical protein